MSKLGADGKPIINECKHYGGDKKPTLMTGVEAIPATMAQCHNRMQFNKCDDPNHLIDPTKPIGKILKGPNYTPPQLGPILAAGNWLRSEEHTSEPPSLMPISYAVFCLKKKKKTNKNTILELDTKNQLTLKDQQYHMHDTMHTHHS